MGNKFQKRVGMALEGLRRSIFEAVRVPVVRVYGRSRNGGGQHVWVGQPVHHAAAIPVLGLPGAGRLGTQAMDGDNAWRVR